MKDGNTLDIDGATYETYQRVTNRRTSTYQNILVVDDVIENITGNYTCKVTNKFGSSNHVLAVRGRYSNLDWCLLVARMNFSNLAISTSTQIALPTTII